MTSASSRARFEPRLGLFWFLAKDRNPSRFAALSCLLSNLDQTEAVRRFGTTHEQAWPDIRRLDQSVEKYGFDFFPRGHIEFSTAQDRWCLVLDPKLNRGAFVAHIVIEFNIPREHLLVRWSHEYRSVACVGRRYEVPRRVDL